MTGAGINTKNKKKIFLLVLWTQVIKLIVFSCRYKNHVIVSEKNIHTKPIFQVG